MSPIRSEVYDRLTGIEQQLKELSEREHQKDKDLATKYERLDATIDEIKAIEKDLSSIIRGGGGDSLLKRVAVDEERIITLNKVIADIDIEVVKLSKDIIALQTAGTDVTKFAKFAWIGVTFISGVIGWLIARAFRI